MSSQLAHSSLRVREKSGVDGHERDEEVTDQLLLSGPGTLSRLWPFNVVPLVCALFAGAVVVAGGGAPLELPPPTGALGFWQ